MGTNDLEITLHDTPQEAPIYPKGQYQAAHLNVARVIGQGTKAGNPTVDLVFEDRHGHKYIAMITGGLIQTLAGAVRGMKERHEPGGGGD